MHIPFIMYKVFIKRVETLDLQQKGNKTILTSTLNYSMKNRMFIIMNRIIGRKKFTKTWDSILAG
jgi:hypothetical protein